MRCLGIDSDRDNVKNPLRPKGSVRVGTITCDKLLRALITSSTSKFLLFTALSKNPAVQTARGVFHWLYRIAVNECLDYLRKQRSWPPAYEANLSEELVSRLGGIASRCIVSQQCSLY